MAIVGVVASLTIPSVVNNFQGKVYETQYKKGVSVLANGMKLLLSQEGVYDLRETSLMACYNLTPANRPNCLNQVAGKIFKLNSDSTTNTKLLDDLKSTSYKLSYAENSFLMPSAYAAGSKGKPAEKEKQDDTSDLQAASSSNNPWNNVIYAFVTSDGIIYGLLDVIQNNNANTGFYILMDANGFKNPNSTSKDLYKFAINNRGKVVNRNCEFTNSCSDSSNNDPEFSGNVPPCDGDLESCNYEEEVDW